MAYELLNRVQFYVASAPGTGVISIGSALAGFRTPAGANMTDGNTSKFVMEDGDENEVFTGTYDETAGTLERTITHESTNGGLPIDASHLARVFSDADSRDVQTDVNITGGAISGLTSLSASSLSTTGNITVGGTVDGRDVAVDGAKLDGVEAGATADQTGAEIKTAYEGEADTNAFTDAEQTKLAGIETGADVTDTANVTAAGALMDSEVDADIKTLALPANTTISAFGATLVDDASAAAARATLDVDQAGTDNSTDVTLAGAGTYLSIVGQVITVDAITESDIADLGSYITASSSETLTNKTIDGDNNTISNLDIGNEVDWAAIGDVADRTAFASGDKLLIFEAGVGFRKIDYDDLPGGGGGTTFADDVFRVQDNADATKQLAFEVSGIATATTRTWTVPDANITFGAYAPTLLNVANEAAFKAAVNLEPGTDILAQQTIGIADNNLLEVDGTPNANEYARFTANGLEGRTEAEFKADFNLEANTDFYAPAGTDVAVADGGTGRSSHTAYAVLCGGTTTTGAQQSIAGVGTSGQVLTSNGASALPTFQDASGGSGRTYGGSQAFSGGAITVTGVPAGVSKITAFLHEFSLSSSVVELRLRLGDSGGLETANYTWTGSGFVGSTTDVGASTSDAYVLLTVNDDIQSAANISYCRVTIERVEESANDWMISWMIGNPGNSECFFGLAAKTLSAELTQFGFLLDTGNFDNSSTCKWWYE